MADLESIIKQKSESDSEWQSQQQAERENVTAMQDMAVELIATDPDSFMRYLNLQGDNLNYSAGNVAIILVGIPEATVFGTEDKWRSLRRNVREGETGVKIFARDQKTGQYTLSDAYDVSQTQGQEVKTTVLRDDTKAMATALETLLNYSKVPISIDKAQDTPAYYSDEQMKLLINPDYPDSVAFASIAAEVALTRFHEKGFNKNFEWEKQEIDAKCVGYIICRKFGIDAPAPDLGAVVDRFDGMTTQEVREALDSIQKMGKQIGHSIDRSLDEKQHDRSSMHRPSR